MKVTWTNTFSIDFDLDQAEEDFREFMYWNPKADTDKAIYDAVEANWYFGYEEIVDSSPAIEQCAKALRERIGGIQLEMDWDTFVNFTPSGNDDRSDTWIR